MTNLPIPIPSGFQISVKPSQKVSAGDTIAAKEDYSSDLVINVASDLDIKPEKTSHTLVKKPGDRIEAGDLIAKKGGMLGSREIHSKVAGTIVKFDEREGTLTIRTQGVLDEDSEIKITSPVDGSVETCDNSKVVLKTDKEAVLAVEGSGENAFGEYEVFDQNEVLATDVDDKVSGKILIAKSFNREAIAKAIGLRAIALIAQDIREIDFENLKEKMIKTPVLRVSSENYKKLIHKGGPPSARQGKIIADAKNLVIVRV